MVEDNFGGFAHEHQRPALRPACGYSKAEREHRALLEDQQRVLGSEHPQVLATRHDVAWAQAQQGRHREAEQGLRLVLADMRRILGHDRHGTLYARLNLARAIAAQGRRQEAALTCTASSSTTKHTA